MASDGFSRLSGAIMALQWLLIASGGLSDLPYLTVCVRLLCLARAVSAFGRLQDRQVEASDTRGRTLWACRVGLVARRRVLRGGFPLKCRNTIFGSQHSFREGGSLLQRLALTHIRCASPFVEFG